MSPDVVIVGGGIAGMSAAYRLAERCSVVLLERESTYTHHSTGRSAAVFIVNYGGPLASRLTAASRSFFEEPPAALADHPFLERCGVLLVADEASRAIVEAALDEARSVDPNAHALGVDDIRAMVPALRPEVCAIALHEPDAATMDVAAIHQAYLRGATAAGAALHTYREVVGIERVGERWRIRTDSGTVEAPVVVDAAGAWGDAVAELAGVRPLGLQAMRRTAFTVPAPPDRTGLDRWPLVHVDTADGPCYFKPEAGDQLLCSPADEVPTEPCDARAEELDVAKAIDRLNAATDLGIRSVRHTWAGLRTFAPDRHPVIGWDDEAPGFCWMVGQGGTGITTSEAAGRLVAGIVTADGMPPDLAGVGLDAAMFAPVRGGARPLPPTTA